MRVLGGEGDGGEDVHDEVDPEQLDDVEGRVAEKDRGEEDEEDAGEVHSHLELDELSDVVLDVPTPADSCNHREEVVIHEDYIGMILRCRAAILSHREAHIGFAQSP